MNKHSEELTMKTISNLIERLSEADEFILITKKNNIIFHSESDKGIFLIPGFLAKEYKAWKIIKASIRDEKQKIDNKYNETL